MDGSGNVIVTGYFGGTVDFGGGTLTSVGSDDIFLARFWLAAPEIRSVRDVPDDQGRPPQRRLGLPAASTPPRST